MLHEKKCVEPYFTDILMGKKKFEIRKNDEDYLEGDYIILNQILNGIPTVNKCLVKVIYTCTSEELVNFDLLKDKVVVMSIILISTNVDYAQYRLLKEGK